jgi:hypothetical protein
VTNNGAVDGHAIDSDGEVMSNDAQYCSFCGKARDEVKHLIAGPAVFICDACVALCRRLIEAAGKPSPEDKPTAFLVRAPRKGLEQWCRELVDQRYTPKAHALEPRWMVLPTRGPSHSLAGNEMGTWKVLIPSSFASLFLKSWPQATVEPGF